MKKIIIQIVPFCYGPTSIAIALGRKLKEMINCEITVLCDGPSLDLVSYEQSIFSVIVDQSINSNVSSNLPSADLVISICDFDFTESFLENFPTKKIVFIDPLLWMWKTIPTIITKCDLYLALEFQGVQEIVLPLSNRRVRMIPQIAEFNNETPSKIRSNNLLVNLGGMQSPLGSNLHLAQTMCEEIINVTFKNKEFENIYIRTGQEVANILREKLPKTEELDISSSSPKTFQNELANCKILLTVPGMSIVYESLQSKTPLLFILPLNYSQHLQIKYYRNAFNKISEIKLADLGNYSELPDNLEELEGVRLANDLGLKLENSSTARKEFRERLGEKLKNWKNIDPLESSYTSNTSGATQVVNLLKNYNLI